MDIHSLRKADFKTGVILVVLSIWYLCVTFAFMPFKETYGGVENVWYVSPWIFPAVVLSLLFLLSVVLIVNAIRCGGIGDIVEFFDQRTFRFVLKRNGALLNGFVFLATIAGLVYFIVNVNEKILASAEEAKWLADPSLAVIFSWSSPQAYLPLLAIALVSFISSSVFLVSFSSRHFQTRKFKSETPDLFRTGQSVVSKRFFIISMLFCGLVYILVPNVDFFLAILVFLLVFTNCFYCNERFSTSFSLTIYLVICAAAQILPMINLNWLVDSNPQYINDGVVLTFTAVYILILLRHFSTSSILFGKFKICLIVSLLTPLILVPVFRFALLVPLPREGLIIEALHQIRYALN